MQRGMLFHALYAPGSGIYVEHLSCIIEGDLDFSAFESGWQRVLNRHAILRTAFFWEGLDEPLQVVRERAKMQCRKEDWRGLSKTEQADRLKELLETDRKRGFVLSQAPLMRYALIQLDESTHQFLLSFHHILLDGWSLSVIFREFFIIYEGLCHGEDRKLPPAIPFSYYIAWLQRQNLAEAEAFWRKMLNGVTAPTPLGFSRSQSNIFNGNGGGYQELLALRIPLETTERLQALGRQHQITLNTLVQGAWAILLSRYCGESDVIFGATVSGRPPDLPDSESMVGLFVNTLPVRARVQRDATVLPWMRELQSQQIEVRHYEYSSLIQVQEWGSAPGGMPLFESIISFQNHPVDTSLLKQVGGREIRDSVYYHTRTGYPLVIIAEPGRELLLTIAYDPHRFDSSTASRVMKQLQTLLEGMASGSAGRLSELPWLSVSERQQLLTNYNSTSADYNNEIGIQDLFERQAGRTPDAIAVVGEEYQVTYRELNRRANQLGNYLKGVGVGPEEVVGICLERSIEIVIGILGILKAGGAYLPLDPAYPDQRLNLMVEDAKIRLLLTQEHLAGRFDGQLENLLCLDRDWAIVSGRSPEHFQTQATPDNAAYVIYTSGSTGRPKGVIVTHRNVINLFNAVNEKLSFNADDVWTLFHSYAFDFSVWEIWGALLYGGRLAVVPYLITRIPEEFYDLIREKGVTILSQTPSAFRHLIKVDERVGVGSDSGLRAVIFGGEALEFQSLQGWMERHGDESPQLINMYGITETTVHTSFKRVTSGDLAETSGSVIGKPLGNMLMYVLDEEMQPVPVGVTGELYVGGAGTARAYMGNSGLTAERFLPAAYGKEPGERIYRAGDLARYLDNGDIEYLGRKDDQVKIRGYRIELGEIESALLQHEAVREAVVIARGETGGEKRLVAYLVNGGGGPLASNELRAYLSSRVPDYMVPEAFVRVEMMPLTPSGKLDRKALSGLQWERREGETSYVAPRTPVEEIVGRIFEQVLRIDQVAIHDDFFEIGGHSLLATQVISRVRETFGVEIGVRSVFEERTVEGLSRRVEVAMRKGEKDEAPPLVRTSRESRPPLSFAQQRLWFIDQLDPGNSAYNITGIIKLEGELDLEALEWAVNQIIRRHEALRTRVGIEDGAPVQLIEEWEHQKLAIEDLKSLPEKEKNEEVRRRAKEEAETRFDLSALPLLRVKVLILEEKQHVMLLAMHHIVSDGWSMGVLIREVCLHYKALREGQGAPLPELEVQYADYAVWQRRWLVGQRLEGEIGYWKDQLKNAAVMNLPTDHLRPAVLSNRGGRERVEIGPRLLEGLNRLGQREGATLFMVLMAAFKVVLMRWSGEEDVSVGTAIANRTRREIEGLIGFFANTLVLRTHLEGNPSFKELIGRERACALAAYARQEVPFEKLVEEINPDRDMSRSPLFQVMMALQTAGQQDLGISGLKVSRIEEETGVAKFDLTLTLTERGEGIFGSLEYSRELYEGETIRRMARHFEKVVEEVVRDTEQRVREIELLSAAERRQIVEEWNKTEKEYVETRLVHEVISEQARLRPEAIAVRSVQGEISYAYLDRLANQLANYLRGLGVGPGVVVGLCLERSEELVIGLLGVLKAGGAYLPLDPEYPVDRLAWMIEDAEASVILTQQRLLERLPASGTLTVCLDRERDIITSQSSQAVTCQASADTLIYVIYTSGSTGRPKGAAVYHRGITNLLRWFISDFNISADDCLMLITSPNFDLTQKNFFAPLMTGATLYISLQQYYDPAGIRQTIREQGATLLNCTPSAFYPLVEEIEESALGDLKSLRLVFLGGEPIAMTRLRRWVTSARCHAQLVNTYGPTECSDICAYYAIEEPERLWNATAPIGRPIYNTRLFILGSNLDLLPVGVVGELCIEGSGVGAGYVNNAELTAEKFIPSRYSDTPKLLYRTGDMARYRADGCIELLGRADHQIKIRGYRIELGEIEAVLRKHPDVIEAVAVARETGGGEKRLVAYLVIRSKTLPLQAELHAFLKERLPDYMTPSGFIVLEKLPLTPNGKIDRRALPEPGTTELEQGDIDRLTPTEEIVGGIFREVLRLDRVGVRDNFFEIGGHSLLATQVISRVRNTFGVEIGVRSLFEEPTVEGLARRIEAAMRFQERKEEPPLVRVSRDGKLFPLSFAQQRLWFINQLDPNGNAYNITGAVKVAGRLDVDALRRGLNEIVRRHEILRTNFVSERGEPWQVICEQRELELPVKDLSNLPEDERMAAAEAIASEEARRGFDLSHGPLLRTKLLKLDGQRHVLLVVMHHIVSDGWSIYVLFRELATLYEAYSRGQDSLLKELELQYVDFAIWQRKWLQGEVMEKQIRYWKEQLDGLESLNLPMDYPRPAVASYRRNIAPLSVSDEVACKLSELSRQEGVTLFMTLLTALKSLLYQYTAQEDIVVGTNIDNRNRSELEGIIGFFVNNLILRTDLSGNPTFRELLSRVRGGTLNAYAHQDLPFEKLIEELHMGRDLSQAPLFQVALVWQNSVGQFLENEGLSFSAVKVDTGTAKFELTFFMGESEGGLAGSVVYNTDLFNSATIHQMCDHFQTLLAGVVAEPDKPISSYSLIPQSQSDETLADFTMGFNAQ